MARIRTVKPELFRHEDLFALEQEVKLPVRLAFIGLFTAADRDGRFAWRPRALQLDVLPYDKIDFSRVLDALASRGFVVRYTVAGQDYGYIPSFPVHQVINNREMVSKLPSPSEGDEIHASGTRAERDTEFTQWKGREGKGKGREKNCPMNRAFISKRILDPRKNHTPKISSSSGKTTRPTRTCRKSQRSSNGSAYPLINARQQLPPFLDSEPTAAPTTGTARSMPNGF